MVNPAKKLNIWNPPAALAIVCLQVLLGFPGASMAAEALKAPFALHAPSVSAGKTTCAPAPAPVIELSVTSKYGNNGPLRDTVDAAAEAESKAQMAPLRDFTKNVVAMANTYSRTGDTATATCALSWLDAWATAHALSQMNDHNAQFERGASLAGLSLALVQISPAVASDPQYATVAAWMHTLAESTRHYFESTKAKLKGSRNNHAYWAGLGVAGVALVTGDRQLLDWSVDTYKTGVCSATPEGGLPLEIGRGTKARDYHLFALNALVPLAAIAEANGTDAFAVCDGALHRIVQFSLGSITDATAITALAGKTQDSYANNMPKANQLAFMEIYHRKFPGRAPLEAQWLALRPYKSTNLGGDQSVLYGK